MHFDVRRDALIELSCRRRCSAAGSLSRNFDQKQACDDRGRHQSALHIQQGSPQRLCACTARASDSAIYLFSVSPRAREVQDKRPEEKATMWNKNEVDGKVGQAKGKAKRAVGKMTNDPDLVAEGDADEAAGKVQDTVGRGARKVGRAIENVGKAVKRG
jgi:uncharacterized protein YjbJ (UPF0337 family)